jgi:hypothetical protein
MTGQANDRLTPIDTHTWPCRRTYLRKIGRLLCAIDVQGARASVFKIRQLTSLEVVVKFATGQTTSSTRHPCQAHGNAGDAVDALQNSEAACNRIGVGELTKAVSTVLTPKKRADGHVIKAIEPNTMGA